ncbi:recombinase family protein [Streptomyces sp. SID13588]|uniref:recombinase family protein n=1 Tax=Streptomyces sp. SID13588 TaxID=2706051 RepID=UPI0013CC38A5|nr:recombinase family protein [Streptomyces sp. SID13588]NEA77210.1 recombinase family protein [Streptomyces sp. SID13588]
MATSNYDGCGRCMVGVRRLSRKTDATSSPTRQKEQVLSAVAAVGGHVIAWADDMEVSGATDPMTRPGFGPWLRGEMGPYDGIAGASVDRIGRNVRDVLNTADSNKAAGRVLVTADHVGLWDLDDPNQEIDLTFKALGAQMEHRAIKKRNIDETERARKAGQPKQLNSYGYRYVRLIPTGKVDHVEIDPVAAKIIREVAERVLTDETGTITCATEAARLTRAAVPSPRDHRAMMYGRERQGFPWSPDSVRNILTSEASLGFLIHGNRPVIGTDGHPVRLAPELWSRATRDQLIEKLAPKKTVPRTRAPKGIRLLSGLAQCGNCGSRIYVAGSSNGGYRYGCQARQRGFPPPPPCKPAPRMKGDDLDNQVTDWFLARYGSGQVMRREFDAGTGYGARIADLKADRLRLREDRKAGLYDDADDAEWYRSEYARMGREIAEFKALPERPPGMHLVPTGQTIADAWHAAQDDAARRELLNNYEVRVKLFPRGAEERVQITGVNVFAQAV